MIEYAKRAVGNIDWIRAGQILGVPAMGMLFLLMIGFYFVNAQSSQWAKDSETRQELLTKLVESQIKQGEATTSTMIRTQAAMEKLEAISERQTQDHSALIAAQQVALKNHGNIAENQTKILTGISRDCDSTKQLIDIQKKILDSLESTRARPFTAPVPSPAKVNKST